VVSRSERRRRLARERWERQQARRAAAEARARRLRRVAGAGLAVAVVVAAVVGAVMWWNGGDEELTALTDPSPEASASASADAGDGRCTWNPTGEAAVPDLGMPPEVPVEATATWTATITIGGQPVGVDLLAQEAPCTVTSLEFLAGRDYFDGTPCHRLTSSESLKVLQCGDPTGSGSGGPGYQFANENTEGATYPAGTVAMANAGADTNGSQFFLVYEDSQLPPDYTVFGRITSGLDVVTGIAAQGTADGSTDGTPRTPVTIDDVVVTGA
jgi:peptidyl-prolyl cis-trans isomerase B (cyclophilin B)